MALLCFLFEILLLAKLCNLPPYHALKCCLSYISPTVVVEVDAHEDPENIKAAVEKALFEALNDGIVGNLNVDPDSVSVEDPHTNEADKGTSFCFMDRVNIFNMQDLVKNMTQFDEST